jgi:hypothetical protein
MIAVRASSPQHASRIRDLPTFVEAGKPRSLLLFGTRRHITSNKKVTIKLHIQWLMCNAHHADTNLAEKGAQLASVNTLSAVIGRSGIPLEGKEQKVSTVKFRQFGKYDASVSVSSVPAGIRIRFQTTQTTWEIHDFTHWFRTPAFNCEAVFKCKQSPF